MRGGLRDKETSTISATSYSTVETVDDFLPTIDPKARHWSRIGIFAYPACSRRNIVIRSGMEKLEWWVYQTAKRLRTRLFISTEYTNVMDIQTDRRHRQHDGKGRAYAWHRAAKTLAERSLNKAARTLRVVYS